MFGDDAIKTYSRKGYQWQLALCKAEGSFEQSPRDGTNTTSQKAGAKTANKKIVLFTLPLVFIFISSLWFTLISNNHEKKTMESASHVYLIEDLSNDLTNNEITADVQAQWVFDSPHSLWKKYVLKNQKYLTFLPRKKQGICFNRMLK